MCAAIAGYTGTVDGVCGEVKGWEVTVTTEMLEVTDFCSSGWKEFIEGLQGATGSLTSTERYSGGATVTLANSAGGVSISGSVFFNEKTVGNEVDGIMEYAQSFTFTGEVTIA